MTKHNSLHCRLLGDLQKLLKSSQALVLNRILQSINLILWEICKITTWVFFFLILYNSSFSLFLFCHTRNQICVLKWFLQISPTLLGFVKKNASKRQRDKVKYEKIDSISNHESEVGSPQKTNDHGCRECILWAVKYAYRAYYDLFIFLANMGHIIFYFFLSGNYARTFDQITDRKTSQLSQPFWNVWNLRYSLSSS